MTKQSNKIFNKTLLMTKILWFTGLSVSGKSTLTQILSNKLSQLNFKVKIIDGDNFRKKNKNKNNSKNYLFS
tara:strand:- start:47 stop:262 length:216 start_codon:yes stop_codon:yes gene_type:complete